MDALLDLEPREAGFHIIEPSVSFENATTASYDRTRCYGCCLDSTEVLETTHSATQ
jgi:hypothetical protein